MEIGTDFPSPDWKRLASGGSETGRSVRFEDNPRELYDKFMNAKEIPFSYHDGQGNQRNLSIRIGKSTPLFKNAMERKGEIGPEVVEDILLRHIANLIPPDQVARGPIGNIKATFQGDRCASVSLAGKNVSRARAVGIKKRKVHSVTTELSYLSKPERIQKVFKERSEAMEILDQESFVGKRCLTLRDIQKIEAMVDGEGFTPELQKEFLKFRNIWEETVQKLEFLQNQYEQLENLQTQTGSTDEQIILQKMQRILEEIHLFQKESVMVGKQIGHLKDEISKNIQRKFLIGEDLKCQRENFTKINKCLSEKNRAIFLELVEIEKKLSSIQIPCGEEDIMEMEGGLQKGNFLIGEHNKFSEICMSWVEVISDSPWEFEKIKMIFLQNLRAESGGIFQFLQILPDQDRLKLLDVLGDIKGPLELINFLNFVVQSHAEHTQRLLEEGADEIKERIQARETKEGILRQRGMLAYRDHLSLEGEKLLVSLQDQIALAERIEGLLELEDPILMEQKKAEVESLGKEILELKRSSDQILRNIQREAIDPQNNDIVNKARRRLDVARKSQKKLEKLIEGMERDLFRIENYVQQKKIETERAFQLREKIGHQHQVLDLELGKILQFMLKERIPEAERLIVNFEREVQERSQFMQGGRSIGELNHFQLEIVQHIEELKSSQINLENLKQIIAKRFEEKLQGLHMNSSGVQGHIMKARSLKDLIDILGALVQNLERKREEEHLQRIEEKRMLLDEAKYILKKHEQDRAILSKVVEEHIIQEEQREKDRQLQMEKIDQIDAQCDQELQLILSTLKDQPQRIGLNQGLDNFIKKGQEIELFREFIVRGTLNLSKLQKFLYNEALRGAMDFEQARAALVSNLDIEAVGDFRDLLIGAQSFPDLLGRFGGVVEDSQRKNLMDLYTRVVDKEKTLSEIKNQLGHH